MSRPVLNLLDTSYFAHASWHAAQSAAKSGKVAKPLQVFAGMVARLLEDLLPDRLVACLDDDLTSWRRRLYQPYKAHRGARPEELRNHFLQVEGLLNDAGVTLARSRECEADDVIAALTTLARTRGESVVVITADRDLDQLVSEYCLIWDHRTKGWRTLETVHEHWGVAPGLIADVKAFAGDASDGIPGAPKVGIEKARTLIKAFGSVVGVYENLHRVHELDGIGKQIAANLVTYREQVQKSLELAQLRTECDVRSIGGTAIDSTRVAIRPQLVAATLRELGDVPALPEGEEPPHPVEQEDLFDRFAEPRQATPVNPPFAGGPLLSPAALPADPGGAATAPHPPASHAPPAGAEADLEPMFPEEEEQTRESACTPDRMLIPVADDTASQPTLPPAPAQPQAMGGNPAAGIPVPPPRVNWSDSTERPERGLGADAPPVEHAAGVSAPHDPAGVNSSDGAAAMPISGPRTTGVIPTGGAVYVDGQPESRDGGERPAPNPDTRGGEGQVVCEAEPHQTPPHAGGMDNGQTPGLSQAPESAAPLLEGQSAGTSQPTEIEATTTGARSGRRSSKRRDSRERPAPTPESLGSNGAAVEAAPSPEIPEAPPESPLAAAEPPSRPDLGALLEAAFPGRAFPVVLEQLSSQLRSTLAMLLTPVAPPQTAPPAVTVPAPAAPSSPRAWRINLTLTVEAPDGR